MGGPYFLQIEPIFHCFLDHKYYENCSGWVIESISHPGAMGERHIPYFGPATGFYGPPDIFAVF